MPIILPPIVQPARIVCLLLLLCFNHSLSSSTLPGAGVFFLSCSEGEQISFLLDCIVRGISPSRTPHGLRPALPGQHGNVRDQNLPAILAAHSAFVPTTRVRECAGRTSQSRRCVAPSVGRSKVKVYCLLNGHVYIRRHASGNATCLKPHVSPCGLKGHALCD